MMFHRRAIAPGLAALALLLAIDARAVAVTHLTRGVAPPPIDLPTLGGSRVTLEGQRGRPAVVVFGELYHQRTLTLCGEIREVLASESLAGRAVSAMLVIGQDEETSTLAERARDPRLPPQVLHDARREVYGAYRVSVMPSVVVIDARGRVVHAAAGYTSRLRDIVNDALLVATGASSYGDACPRRPDHEPGPAARPPRSR
jgi:peroxiredoxin